MSGPLGFGVGLRAAHFQHLLESDDLGVDWFEVISENFFVQGGLPWRVLDRVRRDRPVVMHGVSMAVGNVAPLDPAYMDRLLKVVDRLQPALVSDHLCWGGHGGHVAHDLLPLPYTQEALSKVTSKVQYIQERLRRRILLENVSSYVSYRESEMTEWEFLSEVAYRSGCGVLLDVNNIYVSSQNHGYDPADYLDAIPAESIGQVHLAGHTVRSDIIVDTHVGPVPEVVWALYRRLVARVGPIPSLIEWDESIPEYSVLVAEADRARQEAALA